MKAYVIGSSALYYWRRHPLEKATSKNRVPSPLDDSPSSSEELRSIHLERQDLGASPVHLMVPSPEHRISRGQYRYTVESRMLPENAFCLIDAHVCISSPPYCLVQSARVLSKVRLVELCMELCGTYALVPESVRGFTSREYPLTTQEELESFLQCIPGSRAARYLDAALGLIQNGSRSPMETREYLLLCLPKRYGGYGLPKPQLNYRIDLGPEERRVSRRRYFECDICWPQQMVVMEYDGHDDHESREDRSRDAVKRNMLLARGYKVFTVTGKQICDAAAFDRLVRDIVADLGHRLKSFPSDWALRRDALRKELFKSLSRYESERFRQTTGNT